MKIEKSTVLSDTSPIYIISLDNVPAMAVRTLEQVNETNFTKAFALRGWEMHQESETVVNADKAFVKSFLGCCAPFSQYALQRRTSDGQHFFNVKISKIQYMGLEIIDQPKTEADIRALNKGVIPIDYRVTENWPPIYGKI